MKITAEEVAELNAKRTQGDIYLTARRELWVLDSQGHCDEQIGYFNYDPYAASGQRSTEFNSEFFAAAPAMALLIAEQAEELERYKAALKRIAGYRKYQGITPIDWMWVEELVEYAEQALNADNQQGKE